MTLTLSRRSWLRWLVIAIVIATAIICIVVIVFAWPLTSVIEGVAEFHKGNIDRARSISQQRVSRNPQDGDAWHLLGQCEERAGNYPAAVNAYFQASHQRKDNWNSRVRYAMSLLASGWLEFAEQEFRTLHTERPDDDSIRTELQWLLFNQLRERELEQLLETALARNPENFQLAYHLLYSSQRRPVAQEAVGLLERAKLSRTDQATVDLALGRCYWHLGDAERARPLLQSAHARLMNLESALAWSEFLYEQGEAKEADGVLQPLTEAILKIWRLDDRWWWLRSQRAVEQKNLVEALAAIDEAMRNRPGDVRYAQARATILRALRRSADAKRARDFAAEIASAERALYIIVSRGDLDRPTPGVMREIARHCEKLGKSLQARSWKKLASRPVQ